MLLHGLWHYQYTRFATDLTPEMQSWLYRKTQGIPDVLVKLLYNAQKLCILDGREKLDFEVFESAFLKEPWAWYLTIWQSLQQSAFPARKEK